MITDEGIRRGASRIESAAEDANRAARRLEEATCSASRAADRMEAVAQRLAYMLEDGYGGNALRLIELLEASCSELPP